jgi:DnaJ domain
MREPCNILGVEAGASEAAVMAAFRRAAKRCHPDMNSGDRAGERHLSRLIAARDFLLSRRQRISNRKPAGDLLRLEAVKARRARLFAGGVASAGFLLCILLTSHSPAQFSPSYGRFQTSVIKQVDNSSIPDAESAELKAIRDLREFAGTEAAKPGKVATNGAAAPRHRAPRLQRAVAGPAATMTKTWRLLASKLGGQ